MNDVQDVVDSLLAVIRPLVDRIPGVQGVIVASADGHVLAAQTSDDTDNDAAAAMSASALGLAHRVVGIVGETPATLCHQRSDDAQAFMFAIDHYAVLTLLTDESTRPEQVRLLGAEAVTGLRHIFTDGDGNTDVDTD